MALGIIEERAEVVGRMAEDGRASGRRAVAEMCEGRSAEYRRCADSIRRVVLGTMARAEPTLAGSGLAGVTRPGARGLPREGPTAGPERGRAPADAAGGERGRRLEDERQLARERLQSAVEELHSAKEELETSKEELSTVNGELARRVTELGRAGSDLKNLLASTRIATLFLDNELRVTSVTPAIAGVLPLVESDLGRATDFALLDPEGRARRIAGIAHDATRGVATGERLRLLVGELQDRTRNSWA